MMYELIVPPGTLEDYRRWAVPRVEALNAALEGLPMERVRYHICWGSWNAPHTGDVPLKDIVDLVLRVRAGGYALEQANPRHEHEWRVWETVALPEDRVLLPGVISHATNVVEHPELVAERLTRLARLVGRERSDREHRLRLRSGTPGASCASLDHVGQAGGPGRGCPAGLGGALVRNALARIEELLAHRPVAAVAPEARSWKADLASRSSSVSWLDPPGAVRHPPWPVTRSTPSAAGSRTHPA